ncbi:MAG: sigma-54 dependent transcriptional regulator [Gammaproteobacteria bacterium]|uniref:sigma-54-dependent transcriptional regulator n=1 Tax=Marinomonas sp. BSi20584 TaxID=1594462 RepID=UPI000C1F4BE0|nr:sigma-54 dependent transcriptional regulator [Marinomonas sp. BSi20584]MBU1295805.1 sigma-54 dependent transcriptional regulator [Gammaproteobacteria bacterium]MBU1466663.1 sigma-54 dependent transcriptional regulator [Gammaproteobacteria bacterium]MBU2022772.1 sigma-54 dependent transcriptional regulator [Gammaproteobacteria bacterium]MBU2237122.1 sigma-54 dependent transcriptional regulator [Gammaproteobacteria bacterium]MBU2319337.1 sigma-54 dependent transcriptional regulator [Gammaprot
MHSIMIICPDNSPLKESEKWLSRYGFQVNTSNTLEQANRYYELSEFHLLLIDQEAINHLAESNIELPSVPHRIVLDAKASLSTGVSSMAQGALYYLPLPTDSETLLKHVVNALEQNKQPAQPSKQTTHVLFANTAEEAKEESVALGSAGSGIIGRCPPMQELFSDMYKIAGTHVTVLIRGESGTGKELVAKALHNLSQRHNHPIISVNCAAIPENLIESELFGHEKGAFTGANSSHDGLIFAADKGTLFLDEIGELPLEAQARLLRVLQEGEIRKVGATQSTKVNIRLITATHRNLIEMVKQGLFREDLYYRLYVMELLLPPLRDRDDDISMLAQILLEKACLKHNKPIYKYNQAFDKAIRAHNWPGNVRELENAIERAVILSPPERVEAANLKLADQQKQSSTTNISRLTEYDLMAGTTLDDYFKHFVLTHQHKMTETQLAHSLGISRKSLWERRQKLAIPKKVTN